MKLFSTSELKERQDLINKLTFNICSVNPDDDDDDDKIWVEFFDKDGCRYDSDDITFFIQNEKPSGMYQETEGLFSYDGSLSKSDIKNILLNIGFNEE